MPPTSCLLLDISIQMKGFKTEFYILLNFLCSTLSHMESLVANIQFYHTHFPLLSLIKSILIIKVFLNQVKYLSQNGLKLCDYIQLRSHILYKIIAIPFCIQFWFFENFWKSHTKLILVIRLKF